MTHKLLLAACIALTVISTSFCASFLIPCNKSGTVWITKGSTTHDVVQTIHALDVPVCALHLWIYRIFTQKGVRHGEYHITSGATLWHICNTLTFTAPIQHKLTIPEGWTVHQVMCKLCEDNRLTGPLPDIEPVEGSFLPDTYFFERGNERTHITRKMADAMHQHITKAWLNRDPTVQLTAQEVLTLASIVECETPVNAEKPIIAGVFYNRIMHNMPLQSDPTVAYAITRGRTKLSKPLTYKDLRFACPFNTYLTKGLPPHPIACPGPASIRAVLHPQSHHFFYFVADGKGGHRFSATFVEHKRNIAKLHAIRNNRTNTTQSKEP